MNGKQAERFARAVLESQPDVLFFELELPDDSVNEIASAFEQRGFGVERDGARLTVKVPLAKRIN